MVYLLLVSLWGVVVVEALLVGLELAATRRATRGAGVFFLACLALAGLAASHWLSLVPRVDPRLPGLAFLGAMLLPAAAVLRLEEEAGWPRSRWGFAAILAGALLPAALLPAQIVGTEVCLASRVCAPARPFILLTHLGTGAILLLTAVPAVGQVARQWKGRPWRAFRPTVGVLLLVMAFIHLAGILARVGSNDADNAVRDVAEAALMVLLAGAATRRIVREHQAELAVGSVAATGGEADVESRFDSRSGSASAPALATASAPALASASAPPLASASQPVPALVSASLPASAQTDVAIAERVLALAVAPAEAPVEEPESNALIDDPVQLAQISTRAMADLRDHALYRQPQLRRRNLADRLQVPEYLLSRALNASTGHSFIELVNGLRIEEAKRRLRNGSERVTTIGYDVGFNSLAAFNRAFRDATGQSPSEYRVAPQPGRDDPEPPLVGTALAA